jgi:hypothetical protein
VFGEVAGQVLLPFWPIYGEFAVPHSVLDPMESHIHGLGILVQMLANPSAVELSVFILVGSGCSRSNSLRICRVYALCWPLWQRTPISASEAAAMIYFMILLSKCIGLLGCWMSGGSVTLPE